MAFWEKSYKLVRAPIEHKIINFHENNEDKKSQKQDKIFEIKITINIIKTFFEKMCLFHPLHMEII